MLKAVTVSIVAVFAVANSAFAESLDKVSEDFFNQRFKYEKQEKQSRDDGFVLQRLDNDQGVLSVGGNYKAESVYRDPRYQQRGSGGGFNSNFIGLKVQF